MHYQQPMLTLIPPAPAHLVYWTWSVTYGNGQMSMLTNIPGPLFCVAEVITNPRGPAGIFRKPISSHSTVSISSWRPVLIAQERWAFAASSMTNENAPSRKPLSLRLERDNRLIFLKVVGSTAWAADSSAHARARFMLLMASSISWVFLNPIVAQSTPAFWKANRIAFARSP
jgi:hypothetical protein